MTRLAQKALLVDVESDNGKIGSESIPTEGEGARIDFWFYCFMG